MNILVPLLTTIYFALDIVKFLVIASAIVSWLIAFDVINTRNNFVGIIADFLYRITEPMLRPIRRFAPQFGGIDVSPIILLLLILFLQQLIVSNAY